MQVSANQRLATGQANFIHAQGHRHANEPFDFLEAEQFLAVHKHHVVSRHAVETADVAAIGHADPQVVVHAAKCVDQRFRHRDGFLMKFGINLKPQINTDMKHQGNQSMSGPTG